MLQRTIPINKTSIGLLLILWLGASCGNDDTNTRQLQDIKASRASKFDSTNLKCQIGTQSTDVEKPLSFQDFEYWYAMGTVSDVDNIQMFHLEQLLYNKIEDDMVWCYEDFVDDGDTAVSTSSSPTPGAVTSSTPKSEADNSTNAVRRLLEHRYVSNRRRRRIVKSSTDSRNLNIITFTPGNMDRQTLHNCPDNFQPLMNETGSTSCKVVAGSMRIIAHANEDLRYAIASLRDGLETAMNVDKVGRNKEIPGITFLSYLGDTEDEVLALITAGKFGVVVGDESSRSSSGEGDGVLSDESGSNGGGVVVVPGNLQSDSQQNDNEDESSSRNILITAVGIPLLCLLIILAFLQKNKRTLVSASDYYARGELDHVLVGTGDPPGHYHEGLYHFLPNGQEYLSTNCEFCHKTREESYYLDDISLSLDENALNDRDDRDLATILEDEPYMRSMCCEEENTLCRADSKFGLGQRHLGIDVHNCSSSTCKICKNNQDKNLVFLSRKGKLMFSEPVFAKNQEFGEV